jgi:hypothetical protein
MEIGAKELLSDYYSPHLLLGFGEYLDFYQLQTLDRIQEING